LIGTIPNLRRHFNGVPTVQPKIQKQYITADFEEMKGKNTQKTVNKDK
jgi:hypothetical protein